MNLMERNHNTEQEDDLEELDLEREEDEERGRKRESLLQKPFMTTLLLGIIAALLLCIIALLLFLPGRREAAQTDADGGLQQSITDYAKEQQKNDYVPETDGESAAVTPQQTTKEEEPEEEEEEDAEEEPIDPVSADSDKTAVVVDVEDENDVSYTKEFILNEALPYFADNNQEAIWDLAHLRRYVKLSEGLKGTGNYYYTGDVNGSGRPDGMGLAIYEDNSYYYGGWSNGARSGHGTWFRFYISEKSSRNAMGRYMAHSYAGEWADDLPNGQGAEHYEVDLARMQGGERILQNVVGGFVDGLYDGTLYGYTINNIGTREEWDGVADKGTFELWRDMSAIGECSVWRNKEDHTLCLDIDKSENRNQGIRELWKKE